jgi:hypothetical protein
MSYFIRTKTNFGWRMPRRGTTETGFASLTYGMTILIVSFGETWMAAGRPTSEKLVSNESGEFSNMKFPLYEW